MYSLLGLGLGGLLVPIIRVAFEHSVASGIYTTICAICLCISVGYFAINGGEK